MQTIYPLSDGGALSITVAKYNPPKSENFDGVGVKPDYAVQLTAEQQRNFYELDEETDPQLKKALELAEAVIKTGGFDGLSEIPRAARRRRPRRIPPAKRRPLRRRLRRRRRAAKRALPRTKLHKLQLNTKGKSHRRQNGRFRYLPPVLPK